MAALGLVVSFALAGCSPIERAEAHPISPSPSVERETGGLPGIGTDAASTELEPFAALIGGAWHFEGSYQVFEWGVGRQLVRARSYTVAAGDTTLISEGTWYWHPGEGAIRGVAAAIQMPVSLFDYTTRIDGDRFVHALEAFGDAGGSYTEVWELTDPDHYRWQLFAGSDAPTTGSGAAPMMDGLFERVEWPGR